MQLAGSAQRRGQCQWRCRRPRRSRPPGRRTPPGRDDEPDSGYELVSPVMPLDEAIDQLGKLFDWIEEQDGDIYTNDSTGLHMNISVPQGNDIDYTKLVLFSGDKYILDKYNRLSNNYADSALGQLEARAGQMDANRAAQAMQKMKDNLERHLG